MVVANIAHLTLSHPEKANFLKKVNVKYSRCPAAGLRKWNGYKPIAILRSHHYIVIAIRWMQLPLCNAKVYEKVKCTGNKEKKC